MAESLVRRVRRSGQAARMAHNGLAALRVAAAQHPDVVLLDMEMPFMDGHEVARHLRLDFPRRACFIIAVTARTADERRQHNIESGIDLRLIKPLDPSVVETLLLLECELVNRRQALRADGDHRNRNETGGSSC
jgi:CheY-like chemotaxis protein